MKQQLLEHNFNISNQNNSLREFILETSRPAEDVILEMGAKGFLAGIKYSENEILVAVTEKRTKNWKRTAAVTGNFNKPVVTGLKTALLRLIQEMRSLRS